MVRLEFYAMHLHIYFWTSSVSLFFIFYHRHVKVWLNSHLHLHSHSNGFVLWNSHSTNANFSWLCHIPTSYGNAKACWVSPQVVYYKSSSQMTGLYNVKHNDRCRQYRYNLSFTKVSKQVSRVSHLTRDRSFWRQDFPGNELHWCWQKNLKQSTENTAKNVPWNRKTDKVAKERIKHT